MLENRTSEAAALRQHKKQIASARERLARQEMTIDQTIENLEGDLAMTAAELFEGFDAELQQEYETEIVEKYGEGAQELVDESWRRIGKMTKEDADAISQGYGRVNEQLLELMREGLAAGDDQVQGIVDQHYEIVAKFSTPNAQEYAGLGQLFYNDQPFRANYDVPDPDLAEYLRDAIAVDAANRLT